MDRLEFAGHVQGAHQLVRKLGPKHSLKFSAGVDLHNLFWITAASATNSFALKE